MHKNKRTMLVNASVLRNPPSLPFFFAYFFFNFISVQSFICSFYDKKDYCKISELKNHINMLRKSEEH